MSFETVSLPLQSHPYGEVQVRIGDLDGNGLPDLALSHWGRDAGTVLQLTPRSFAEQTLYPVASPTPKHGATSLALLYSGVYVFHNAADGTGAMVGPQVYLERSWHFITADDLNGDGLDDLASRGQEAAQVAVLFARADRSFSEPVFHAVGAPVGQVRAGDLDGDGLLDLVAANQRDGDLSLLRGLGDGTFAGQVRIPVGGLPFGLALSDLDGDGCTDLAVTDGNEQATLHLLFHSCPR